MNKKYLEVAKEIVANLPLRLQPCSDRQLDDAAQYVSSVLRREFVTPDDAADLIGQQVRAALKTVRVARD